MAGSFGKQSGKFGPASSRDPKSSGTPTAGITNKSTGECAGCNTEVGKGTGPNSSRIR